MPRLNIPTIPDDIYTRLVSIEETNKRIQELEELLDKLEAIRAELLAVLRYTIRPRLNELEKMQHHNPQGYRELREVGKVVLGPAYSGSRRCPMCLQAGKIAPLPWSECPEHGPREARDKGKD